MSFRSPREPAETTFQGASPGLLIARVLLVAGLVAVSWSSLVPIDDVPLAESASDKLLHLAAYAFLGIVASFAQRAVRPVLTVVLLTIFGLLIEILQGLTGYRSFDLRDLLADTIGAALGILLVYAIRLRSRRRGVGSSGDGAIGS